MRYPICMTLFVAGLFLAGCDEHDRDEHTETCGVTTETYSAGMETEGDNGVYSFILVSSDPGPPDKGENTITVKVVDLTTGDGVEDLVVYVSPYMAEHGHGTSPEDYTCDATGGTGEYQSEVYDLFMGGVWDLVVTAEDQLGEVIDVAAFRFCVEA